MVVLDVDDHHERRSRNRVYRSPNPTQKSTRNSSKGNETSTTSEYTALTGPPPYYTRYWRTRIAVCLIYLTPRNHTQFPRVSLWLLIVTTYEFPALHEAINFLRLLT